MRKQEAVDYLDERVLHFLKENGFDYVKIDYNANLGIGPWRRFAGRRTV